MHILHLLLGYAQVMNNIFLLHRLKTFAEDRGNQIMFTIKEPSEEHYYGYLWKATTRIFCYKVTIYWLM